MASHEKDQLLALLPEPGHWCQSAEARRANGASVTYADPEATAWDLTGAACHLFGWRRACELFIQIERHLRAQPRAGVAGGDAAVSAMVGLQRWNEDPQTSHPVLLAALARVPVSNRASNDEQPFPAALNGASDGVPDDTPPIGSGGVAAWSGA